MIENKSGKTLIHSVTTFRNEPTAKFLVPTKWEVELVEVENDEQWLAVVEGAQQYGELGFSSLGLAKAYITRLIKGSNGSGWQNHEFFILQPNYAPHDRFHVYVK